MDYESPSRFSARKDSKIRELISFFSPIKDCGGSVNQSFGWLNFTSDKSFSYFECSADIGNAGMNQGVALIYFQDTKLWSCK